MISRRTLFARLTAVALAPLAKWLPKPPKQPHVTVIDIEGIGLRGSDIVNRKNCVFTYAEPKYPEGSVNVTVNFHCHHCYRDGFIRLLGDEAPVIKLACPACGERLADAQVGIESGTIYMSRVGDSTNWDCEEEA